MLPSQLKPFAESTEQIVRVTGRKKIYLRLNLIKLNLVNSTRCLFNPIFIVIPQYSFPLNSQMLPGYSILNQTHIWYTLSMPFSFSFFLFHYHIYLALLLTVYHSINIVNSFVIRASYLCVWTGLSVICIWF